MKTTLMMVTVFLLGLSVAGCGEQPSKSAAPASGGNQGVVSMQASLPAQKDVPAAVKQVSADAGQAATEAQKNLQQAASEMAQKAQVLLSQAKQYLDQGKLSEAIDTAQKVLQFDPQNLDAQKIIEIAKSKLKAMAQEKAGEVQGDLMKKLGTMGQ